MTLRVSAAISLMNLYLWSRWSESWQSRQVSRSQVSQNRLNFSYNTTPLTFWHTRGTEIDIMCTVRVDLPLDLHTFFNV